MWHAATCLPPPLFPFRATLYQVYRRRGGRAPKVHQLKQSTHTSITATICANGRALALIVVTKAETLGVHNVSTDDETIFGVSSNGWPTKQHLHAWKDMFIADMKDKGDTQRLVFCDGHRDHFDEAFIYDLIAANIHLIIIPPGCTHVLQPLDRLFFGPIKMRARALAKAALKRLDVKFFRRAMEYDLLGGSYDLASLIKKAFVAAGMFPFTESKFTDATFAAADDILGTSKATALKSLSAEQESALRASMLERVSPATEAALKKAREKAEPYLQGTLLITGNKFWERKRALEAGKKAKAPEGSFEKAMMKTKEWAAAEKKMWE